MVELDPDKLPANVKELLGAMREVSKDAVKLAPIIDADIHNRNECSNLGQNLMALDRAKEIITGTNEFGVPLNKNGMKMTDAESAEYQRLDDVARGILKKSCGQTLR